MINRYIKYYFDYWPILVPILIVLTIAWGLSREKELAPQPISVEYKIDSLNNMIDSLQTEIFYLEDGFDFKEHRYEDVIFEYELGLSYLKDYHPNAYKDFHRIIGMKERYSNELKKENIKRLNQYKNK